MTLKEIENQLIELRSSAAKINNNLCARAFSSGEEAREAKKEYMRISAQIAELKGEKNKLIQMNAAANVAVKESASNTKVKLASLYFPKEQRVQYFATEMELYEMMLMLEEIFEDDVPAISSFFAIPSNVIDSIPKKWFELNLVI